MGIGEQFEFEKTGRIDPEPGTPEYEARLQRLFEENARLKTELEDVRDQRDDLKRHIKELWKNSGE